MNNEFQNQGDDLLKDENALIDASVSTEPVVEPVAPVDPVVTPVVDIVEPVVPTNLDPIPVVETVVEPVPEAVTTQIENTTVVPEVKKEEFVEVVDLNEKKPAIVQETYVDKTKKESNKGLVFTIILLVVIALVIIFIDPISKLFS